MKAIELRKQPRAELASLLEERLVRRDELVMGLAARKVKNVRELRAVRRDIARLKTVLGQQV